MGPTTGPFLFDLSSMPLVVPALLVSKARESKDEIARSSRAITSE